MTIVQKSSKTHRRWLVFNLSLVGYGLKQKRKLSSLSLAQLTLHPWKGPKWVSGQLWGVEQWLWLFQNKNVESPSLCHKWTTQIQTALSINSCQIFKNELCREWFRHSIEAKRFLGKPAGLLIPVMQSDVSCNVTHALFHTCTNIAKRNLAINPMFHRSRQNETNQKPKTHNQLLFVTYLLCQSFSFYDQIQNSIHWFKSVVTASWKQLYPSNPSPFHTMAPTDKPVPVLWSSQPSALLHNWFACHTFFSWEMMTMMMLERTEEKDLEWAHTVAVELFFVFFPLTIPWAGRKKR